jgi:hypothetical protein
MTAFLQKYATPFTTGFFLISLISGMALFFHVGTQYFRGMHEWLSMVLILPFVFHIWKNWRAFLAYFKRTPMLIALGLSLVAGLAFAIPAGMTTNTGGGNPIRGIARALENSSLATVAPVFGHDVTSLTALLSAAGYTISAPDQTLDAIAKASGKNGMEILTAIVAAKK